MASLPQLPATQVAGAVQSPFAAQVVLHAPLEPHPHGSHSVEVTVLQLPAPSQVRAGVATSPMVQVAGPQTVVVPYSWHFPVPSHRPLVPHVEAAAVAHWLVGLGAWPAGIALQVPALPDTAQDMHVPVHAVAQQTPWAQTLEAHSVPVEQVVPFGFSEQLPLLQTVGDTQSALVVQVSLHALAVVSHVRLPGQVPAVTGLHVPAPSQVAAGVKLAPVQEAAAHWVPPGQSRQ
jgi:hypothetical protein